MIQCVNGKARLQLRVEQIKINKSLTFLINNQNEMRL